MNKTKSYEIPTSLDNLDEVFDELLKQQLSEESNFPKCIQDKPMIIHYPEPHQFIPDSSF